MLYLLLGGSVEARFYALFCFFFFIRPFSTDLIVEVTASVFACSTFQKGSFCDVTGATFPLTLTI